MRHLKKQAKLGRQADHRRSMLRNLATSVILYERVKTTEAKGKAVRQLVEKLVTVVRKKPESLAIREINSEVFDKNASRKLVKELKKRYEKRESGFTRLTRLGYRMSDASPMVQIELINEG